MERWKIEKCKNRQKLKNWEKGKLETEKFKKLKMKQNEKWKIEKLAILEKNGKMEN